MSETDIEYDKDQDENYSDIDGNPVSLEKLCRIEPMWACSAIRQLQQQLASVEKERDALWRKKENISKLYEQALASDLTRENQVRLLTQERDKQGGEG